jgi:hypothetical protein
MNPRFFLRIRPQENRENVEKSQNSRPKNEAFGEKLTPVILKTNARNGAITGLQPNRKRGQRKSVPFMNGGEWLTTWELSINTQSCWVGLERE